VTPFGQHPYLVPAQPPGGGFGGGGGGGGGLGAEQLVPQKFILGTLLLGQHPYLVPAHPPIGTGTGTGTGLITII